MYKIVNVCVKLQWDARSVFLYTTVHNTLARNQRFRFVYPQEVKLNYGLIFLIKSIRELKENNVN